MQKPLTFTCRKRDLRRIKITCRCGKVSVAEIPRQVARALNFYPCPGCQAGFTITQDQAGKWKVERVVESVADMAVVYEQPTQEDSTSFAGLRIRIVDAEATGRGTNPHPEHIGKSGTIVGEEKLDGGTTPVIKLDDGTRLTGAECWWELIKN